MNVTAEDLSPFSLSLSTQAFVKQEEEGISPDNGNISGDGRDASLSLSLPDCRSQCLMSNNPEGGGLQWKSSPFAHLSNWVVCFRA